MRKILSSLLVFLAFFFTLAVTQVSARILTSENGEVSVAKGEIVNDDLFIGAQSAVIDGAVNGDVFIGAQTVRIDGVINGNLHVGARTLNLTGSVKGNVYAGAQDITIDGATIGGSLLAGAQNISIDEASSIGGSLLTGGAMVSLDSSIKRSAYIGAGIMTLGPNVKIGKDLYYSADQNQIKIDQKAKIIGKTFSSEYKAPEKNTELARKQFSAFLSGAKVASMVLSFLGALIVGFIYLKLFGKSFTASSETVAKFFWKSLGVGFVVTIALIPGLIILLITVIGIPVAGLAFILFLLYSYLAKIVVGATLGKWISGRFNWKISTYWAFALGLLLVYILKSVIFIGPLVGLMVFWSGLGALTLRLFTSE